MIRCLALMLCLSFPAVAATHSPPPDPDSLADVAFDVVKPDVAVSAIDVVASDGFTLPAGLSPTGITQHKDTMTMKPVDPVVAQPEHIAQFFDYAHLPPHLKEVSKGFADLAQKVLELPRNPERTVALRKLLEAKDAAVRTLVAKPSTPLPAPASVASAVEPGVASEVSREDRHHSA
jgi:hypothetical protein